MGDKAILIEKIKEWININNEISKIQKQMREYRKTKQQITELLLKIMNKNDIDCFDINNGRLMCKKNRIKGTINNELLINSLSEYFKNSKDIDIKEVVLFINENRPIKEKDVLIIKEKR